MTERTIIATDTPASNPMRSLLFVPGNRPERFAKAFASGADMVCIDLEDAVPPSEKAAARDAALQFANQVRPPHQLLVIRLNAASSAAGQLDLAAFADVPKINAMLMLAKLETHDELAKAIQQLAATNASNQHHQGVIALLESAIGIENAFAIAQHPAVQMMMLGGADYCAELGAVMNQASLWYPRSRLAAACAAYGRTAIDVPFLDVHDPDGLSAETKHISDLGMACKSAIHPNQIATIHQALAPSSTELENANRIVEAAKASQEAAFLVDGKMIDRPIVIAAERVLARRQAQRF
jgi:(S)-citramalyl-CoA lyase